MKSDTERKKFHTEKLHRKKSRLHVHLSKDLRAKIKKKKRSLLVRKGDTVKIMRGPHKGKEAKVSDVNVVRRVVFLEGIAVKNARGREMPMPLQPSNLLLLSLDPTKERKEMFAEEAFRKKEASKPKEAKPDGHKEEAKAEHKHEHKAEHEPEHKAPEHKAEHKSEHKTEHHSSEHKEHRPEHKAKHEHAK